MWKKYFARSVFQWADDTANIQVTTVIIKCKCNNLTKIWKKQAICDDKNAVTEECETEENETIETHHKTFTRYYNKQQNPKQWWPTEKEYRNTQKRTHDKVYLSTRSARFKHKETDPLYKLEDMNLHAKWKDTEWQI